MGKKRPAEDGEDDLGLPPVPPRQTRSGALTPTEHNPPPHPPPRRNTRAAARLKAPPDLESALASERLALVDSRRNQAQLRKPVMPQGRRQVDDSISGRNGGLASSTKSSQANQPSNRRIANPDNFTNRAKTMLTKEKRKSVAYEVPPNEEESASAYKPSARRRSSPPSGPRRRSSLPPSSSPLTSPPTSPTPSSGQDVPVLYNAHPKHVYGRPLGLKLDQPNFDPLPRSLHPRRTSDSAGASRASVNSITIGERISGKSRLPGTSGKLPASNAAAGEVRMGENVGDDQHSERIGDRSDKEDDQRSERMGDRSDEEDQPSFPEAMGVGSGLGWTEKEDAFAIKDVSSASGSDYSQTAKDKRKQRAARVSRGKEASDTEEDDEEDEQVLEADVLLERQATSAASSAPNNEALSLPRQTASAPPSTSPPRLTAKQKGKGREFPPQPEVDQSQLFLDAVATRCDATAISSRSAAGVPDDGDNDYGDNMQGGDDGSGYYKSGPLPNELKLAAHALGRQFQADIDALANKWRRAPRRVKIATGFGLVNSRETSLNHKFRTWYYHENPRSSTEDLGQSSTRMHAAWRELKAQYTDEHGNEDEAAKKMVLQPMLDYCRSLDEETQPTALTSKQELTQHFVYLLSISQATNYYNRTNIVAMGVLVYTGTDAACATGSTMFGGTDLLKRLIEMLGLNLEGFMDKLTTYIKALQMNPEQDASDFVNMFNAGGEKAGKEGRDEYKSFVGNFLRQELGTFGITASKFPWVHFVAWALKYKARLTGWDRKLSPPGLDFKSRGSGAIGTDGWQLLASRVQRQNNKFRDPLAPTLEIVAWSEAEAALEGDALNEVPVVIADDGTVLRRVKDGKPVAKGTRQGVEAQQSPSEDDSVGAQLPCPIVPLPQRAKSSTVALRPQKRRRTEDSHELAADPVAMYQGKGTLHRGETSHPGPSKPLHKAGAPSSQVAKRGPPHSKESLHLQNHNHRSTQPPVRQYTSPPRSTQSKAPLGYHDVEHTIPLRKSSNQVPVNAHRHSHKSANPPESAYPTLQSSHLDSRVSQAQKSQSYHPSTKVVATTSYQPMPRAPSPYQALPVHGRGHTHTEQRKSQPPQLSHQPRRTYVIAHSQRPSKKDSTIMHSQYSPSTHSPPFHPTHKHYQQQAHQHYYNDFSPGVEVDDSCDVETGRSLDVIEERAEHSEDREVNEGSGEEGDADGYYDENGLWHWFGYQEQDYPLEEFYDR